MYTSQIIHNSAHHNREVNWETSRLLIPLKLCWPAWNAVVMKWTECKIEYCQPAQYMQTNFNSLNMFGSCIAVADSWLVTECTNKSAEMKFSFQTCCIPVGTILYIRRRQLKVPIVIKGTGDRPGGIDNRSLKDQGQFSMWCSQILTLWYGLGCQQCYSDFFLGPSHR